jgi:hypothetical protein
MPEKSDSIFHKPNGAGKGDKPRKGSDLKKYRENWEKIFKKKEKK